MKTVVESAIKALAARAEAAPSSHEAMQFAQAALSLAHVMVTLADTDRITGAKAPG